MDVKTLEMLEFHRVREIIAEFTSFSLSRDMSLNLQPSSDFEQVSLLLRQSAEARRLLSLQPDLSAGEISDIREVVKMAAQGKVLEPQALLEIQQTLSASRRLRGNLSKLRGNLPLLWNIAEGIVELPQIEKSITACITAAGQLQDSASPRLANIRRGLREAREQLIDHLESIIRSPRGHKIVREPIITEREGRYVIPIKIESRKEIKGIVHDVSNTGVTLFVEPWTTVEQGNQLRELVTEERREIERILRDLSIGVAAHESEITHNVALTAELDLALAKAKYARSTRATEPILTTFHEDGKGPAHQQTGALKLAQARHPLLGEKAVPLSVEIGRDFSILVITGPNTGGKTVAVKTIGLLVSMAQAGLPIPASEESRVPVFDGVFADIGDEQSIEQTLSTFSWHMSNVLRITESATRRSLVLLDELGGSTDPVEGSALARSILLYFLSRQTMTVATTHYSDLKLFAHTTSGLQNASLDFDPVTLAPTYHLTVGVPGGSNALATASRLGLPAEIVTAAREMLPRGAGELETLLASLSSEKQRLEQLRLVLQKESEEAERRNRELESDLQRLRKEEQDVIRETQGRVAHEAAELHREIRHSVSELRKEKSQRKIEQARRALATVHQSLQTQVWEPSTGPETAEQTLDEGIGPGDTIRLIESNLEARVLSVAQKTQQIEVQVGQTRIWLGLNGVEKIAQVPGAADSRATLVKKDVGKRKVSLELDLRGKRAEEVEWALDSYLNSASLANLSEARIIHGFGTGTVRTIVRDFVASHSLVKSFRPGERGEGGDGVTIVNLQRE